MNLLVDALPDAVQIGEKEYPIHTDFRSALRTMMAFEDDSLVDFEKQVILLENLYPEMPHDLNAAITQAVRFLNGGEDSKEEEPKPRLYSFTKDAALIFAAFRQTHGIDLETADLHWWKFMALFGDLGADTAFCALISLRKRIKTGKASKEDRQIAQEMGEAFDVPDYRTPEEQADKNEFFQLLEEGEKQRAATKS